MSKFIINLTVSIALVSYLVSSLDFGQMSDRLLNVNLTCVSAALIVMLLLSLPLALRWSLVMQGISATLAVPVAVKFVFIGNFFNQTLPSNFGGDFARIWLVYKGGLDKRTAVNGVILDRISGLVALIALVAISIPSILSRIGSITVSIRLSWILAVLLIVFVFGFFISQLIKRMPVSLRRSKFATALFTLLGDALQLARYGNYTRIFLLGVFNHIAIAFVVFLLAIGFQLQITFADCLFLVPLVMLATTIPISVAGWGVREGGMVLALGYLGIPAVDAITVSILFGLVSICAGVPGGVLWLFEDQKSLKNF